MAWEAITKAQVATLCGVAASNLQDVWYDIAVDLIERHAGIYNIGKSVSVDEKLDGNGSTRIRVNNPPISSVSAVYIDDVFVESSRYTFNDTSIIAIESLAINPRAELYVFPKGAKNIRVVYTSGEQDYSVGITIALIVKELSGLKSMEGAEARIQTYRPGSSNATELPLTEWGVHGKIMGIISTLVGRKVRFG